MAALPVGCKTVYSDVYSPRRNYYHPPVEKKVELPVDKKASSTPVAPGPAAPAAIPGLAPAPDILPMPAPAPAPAPAQ